jgi:error-prone DNA polymerase
LRTLGAIEEALALIEETTGARPDVDHLSIAPPDPATMRLIRSGHTVAVFQLESPGQGHLLAQTQPTSFDDLIVETALFRPGPIQGGFIHPYVARRQARLDRQGAVDAHPTTQRRNASAPAASTGLADTGAADDLWCRHPVLAPIVADTQGILLF